MLLLLYLLFVEHLNIHSDQMKVTDNIYSNKIRYKLIAIYSKPRFSLSQLNKRSCMRWPNSTASSFKCNLYTNNFQIITISNSKFLIFFLKMLERWNYLHISDCEPKPLIDQVPKFYLQLNSSSYKLC